MTSYSELYRELQPYLCEDEQVLWTGKPSASRYRISPIFAVFALFWCGFAVFWTMTAASIGGAFGLFGIPFVCVGVFLIYSVFIGQKKTLQTAVYAVTDRRAIILLRDGRGTNMTEFIFGNLSYISLENVQGNVGTIRFVQPMSYYQNGYGYGNGYYGRRRGGYDYRRELFSAFYMIENVHEVHRMISEQLGR